MYCFASFPASAIIGKLVVLQELGLRDNLAKSRHMVDMLRNDGT